MNTAIPSLYISFCFGIFSHLRTQSLCSFIIQFIIQGGNTWVSSLNLMQLLICPAFLLLETGSFLLLLCSLSPFQIFLAKTIATGLINCPKTNISLNFPRKIPIERKCLYITYKMPAKILVIIAKYIDGNKRGKILDCS